jgi:wyosine [tRNA(Phe)-imidazoG37] synthetase (radical SAM superfamily)
MRVERDTFYAPEDIFEKVSAKLSEAKEKSERVDIVTFVPDGEPTLDKNLGIEIEMLRSLETRIGVVSNSSLIWRDDVRNDLSKADWVSLKIDSVNEATWRKTNRPHRSLKLKDILDGIQRFDHDFDGDLATETMLVKGLNDSDAELRDVAEFISKLESPKSYISVPTRPPAETKVETPTEERVSTAYCLFKERNIDVECLAGYEGDLFGFTGNVRENILSIASVHPMRESAVSELLRKAGEDWLVIDELVRSGELVEVDYRGAKYFIRRFARPSD